MGDAIFGTTTPNFELGFAGTTTSDPAGKTRKRIIFLGKPRQAVLQLGEFHLQFAVTPLGALREDVENQLGPIDHLQIRDFRDGKRLRGR